MKIAAVVITYNRIDLLPRALKSIEKQNRQPNFVFVVSNSTDINFELEKAICADFGFFLTRNVRTHTYTGALNTSIEEIIKHFGIDDTLYFASLDDDDAWLPNYLQEIDTNNTDNFDLIIGGLLRHSNDENELQILPKTLSIKDFLIGNPGICGSNTFIRLTKLLEAGSFDENVDATADRDLMVRVFQQKPTYKIINKHLVTQFTDNDRPRVTTSGEKKQKSLLVFYYKYQHLMTGKDKNLFFERAYQLFFMPKEAFEDIKTNLTKIKKQEIGFKNKGNYPFIIGFIAGDKVIAERIVQQIIEKNIPVDLVVMIDNTQEEQSLELCVALFNSKNINCSLIKK